MSTSSSRCARKGVFSQRSPRAPLLALLCEAQSAEVVCHALRVLFVEHGAPLVLKSDNGSAFVATITEQLLAQHEVLPLLSPVGTPEYNGACEAGIVSPRPDPS